MDLPKLVIQLGSADAQRHGMPDGGLLLFQPSGFESVTTPLDQAGKLVSAGDGDGERLQLAAATRRGRSRAWRYHPDPGGLGYQQPI
ncbi:MAG: hypothetical protein K9N23_00395 [Akkermansiaceae bacterium]|nr:hypothetical protein [Akkermansiaceae bacterium]